MCGICAGIGKTSQTKNVVDGLKILEYRGYDSCGIAFVENEKLKFVKSVGQIKQLEEKTKAILSNVVIGHTRWATHGEVNEANAHPHFSSDGKFAVVHNGIIENYKQLKQNLKVKLKSETDTEVYVNLIASQKGSALQKIISASKKVIGSFAFALLSQGENKIYLGKRNSPLYVAQNQSETWAASDLSVFVDKFEDCFVLEDDEFAVIDENKVEFFDENGKKIKKGSVSLKKFEFFKQSNIKDSFMLKEINEQPYVLKNTLQNFENKKMFEKLNIDEIKKFEQFHFIACGTAYHSSLLAAKFLQDICQKQTSVSIASEFRYNNNLLSKNCLYVFVSQSGETADTIACAKLVKEAGCKILCETNVPYCSLNSLADYILPTYAGKECAVASTKAYSAQIFSMLLLAFKMAGKEDVQQLKNFVDQIKIYKFKNALLKKIMSFKKIFYMGRQQDYVTAIEGALKLKEISYINCLGIAAGELKHGTLALIDENTLVVAISTQKRLKEKIESNIEEVKARGGKVLLISNFKHEILVDFEILLQDFEEFLMPIVSIIPLQMLAFEYCRALGYDPDKPRNLAKSVTVE